MLEAMSNLVPGFGWLLPIRLLMELLVGFVPSAGFHVVDLGLHHV